MTREDILTKLQDVFRSVFDDETLDISENMTAQDYEPWDSLSHIRLIVAVEKHFSCRFSNAEVARLGNVGDLLNLVERKTRSAA